MINRSALIVVGYFILQIRLGRLTLKKQAIYGVLLLSLIFLITNTTTANTSSSSFETYEWVASNLEQTIDYGNSTQTVFSNLSGITAFDILNQTTLVTFIQFAYGKFIQSINGVENNADNNGYYWQYWVNDYLAPVAADNYVLSDGDHVLWKYCAPEHTTTPSPTINPELIVVFGIIGAIGVIVLIASIWAYIKLR